MSDGITKKLLRPHVCFNLAIHTPLAKQLFGVTVRMANALAKLAETARHSMPPDQAKKVTAASYEIIANVRVHLETEKAALQGQQIQEVTNFPEPLKKQFNVLCPCAVGALRLLNDFDKLVRTWYDLWFLGNMDADTFDAKIKEWRKRFCRASVHINSLSRSRRLNKGQPRNIKGTVQDSNHLVATVGLSVRRRLP